jgi:hypothetical protein
MRLRNFAEQHPLWFALALIALILLLQLVSGLVLRRVTPSLVLVLLGIEAVLASSAALLLTLMRWWREVGFTSPARWRDLQVYALPLALLLCATTAALILKRDQPPLQIAQ